MVKVLMKFHWIPTSNMVDWQILMIFAFDLYFELWLSYGDIPPLTIAVYKTSFKTNGQYKASRRATLEIGTSDTFDALGSNTHRHFVTFSCTKVSCILNILFNSKERDVVWCCMTQNIASVCFRWWSKLPMKFHGIPTSNIVGWHILIVFAFDL